MIHIYIEIGLDIIMAGLAIVLITKAQDNRLRRVWGWMILCLSITMIYENIQWAQLEDINIRERMTLLSIPIILKWYAFAHTLSLFTLGSLFPAWTTPIRIIALSQFPIIAFAIAGTYMWFNGYITPLNNVGDAFLKMSNMDVHLRFGLFCLSVISPVLTLMIPLALIKGAKRRLTSGMYIYIGCFFLLGTSYTLFILLINDWILRIFGYISAILPCILSVLYLRDENPLSHPYIAPKSTKEQATTTTTDTSEMATHKLFTQISKHMKYGVPFTNPNYTLKDLSYEIRANKNATTQAIKAGGFIGFREYINFLRLEYFKLLAATIPGVTVKELMFRCGFTSRSSFYRQFAEQESISPKEYLELHGNKTSTRQTNIT